MTNSFIHFTASKKATIKVKKTFIKLNHCRKINTVGGGRKEGKKERQLNQKFVKCSQIFT